MNKAIAYPNYEKILSKRTQEDLKAVLNKNPENETCGFVLKNGYVIEVENVSDEPKTSFFMSPKDQMHVMTAFKNEIIGIWHTHTNGYPWPSESDELGVLCGLPADYYYWIVTKEDVYQFEWDVLVEHRYGITTLYP
jgi:proteasome lid subunit RPN8/RPN11